MATTATATAPTTLTIPQKFDELEAMTNGIVFERVPEVRCILNALLSGRHVCMIGPPGIAKSMLTRTLVQLISGLDTEDYFEWFLGKFSTPEELFGPHSPKALVEEDQFRRNTAFKLPRAKFAFIDEFFKPSTALLNMLLPIMNERLFFNAGGAPERTPLSTLIGCSNETPEESNELFALWDRLAFRLFTKPITNGGNFNKMLRAAARRMAGEAPPAPVISWNEVSIAQAQVHQVVIPDDVFDAMNKLWSDLAREGITPSERRYVECLPIIQAQAWRAGRAMANINDLRLLSNVLWTQASQVPVVTRIIAGVANPLDLIAMGIAEGVENLARQVEVLLRETDNELERSRKGMAVHGKLEQAAADLGKLREQADAEGRQSEIMDPLRYRILGLTRILLNEVFTFDESGPLAPEAA